MPDPPDRSRAIRSYVRRAGRITLAQERALLELWPRYGLEFEPAWLDLDRIFDRVAQRTLEIGFGNGEHLLERARSNPERDFLGVEVHQIAPASLDELQLLFPDPWPKERHHKRRIVQPSFATLVASRLKPGGLWHLATDWEPYAQHMLEVLRACESLRNCAADGGFIDSVQARSATRFERRGVQLGHRVRELLFVRL